MVGKKPARRSTVKLQQAQHSWLQKTSEKIRVESTFAGLSVDTGMRRTSIAHLCIPLQLRDMSRLTLKNSSSISRLFCVAQLDQRRGHRE